MENDNGRVQLLAPRTGAPLRLLSMTDRCTGLAVEIRGPGGCTAVSEKWRRAGSLPAGGLLGLCDSHGEQRVLIVDVESGLVQHTLTLGPAPAGSSNNTCATSTAEQTPESWFPTCVAEPRPGLLAVTDREYGRVILFRCVSSGGGDGDDDGRGVASSVLLEGLVRPVGCSVLQDGSLAVTDTGRGLIQLVPPSAF